ncbi:hypothetical protein DL96DRAFT_1555255 [Flagelloscypha sp. PMI_526]|nr:hypothetical protein DL96DRAFT_1555255 [Flagelloscypha sp. PMI_526]
MRSFTFISAIALTFAGFVSAAPVAAGASVETRNVVVESVPVIVNKATAALQPLMDELYAIPVGEFVLEKVSPITGQITDVLNVALASANKLADSPADVVLATAEGPLATVGEVAGLVATLLNLVLGGLLKFLGQGLEKDVADVLCAVLTLVGHLLTVILGLVGGLLGALLPLVGGLLGSLSGLGLGNLISL